MKVTRGSQYTGHTCTQHTWQDRKIQIITFLMQEKVLVSTVSIDLGYSTYLTSTSQYLGVKRMTIDCTILD